MKLVFCLIFCLTTSLYAAQSSPVCDFTPIFYGTLLEFATVNNAPGELSVQPYIYGGICRGYFDNNWNLIHDSFGIINPELFIYLGLTRHMQFSAFVDSQTVWYKGHSATSWGDSYCGLGWQFLWDQKNTPIPNLRLDTLAVFPTGKYKHLGMDFNGNNSSGLGSYGAIFVLVTNKIFYINPCHPIDVSLDVGYVYLGKTNVQGVNAYGGGPDTHGTIDPKGRAFVFFDLEYYINSRLNFALDVQYEHGFSSPFKGFLGNLPDNTPATIVTEPSDEWTVLPALEIGFTKDMALYVGVYLTVAGRNTQALAEGVVSFLVAF